MSKKGNKKRFITRGQSYDEEKLNRNVEEENMLGQQQSWQHQQTPQQPISNENRAQNDGNMSHLDATDNSNKTVSQLNVQQIPQQQFSQVNLQQPHIRRNVVRSPSLNSPRMNRHQFDKYQQVLNFVPSYQEQLQQQHQQHQLQQLQQQLQQQQVPTSQQPRRISLNETNKQLAESHFPRSPIMVKRTPTTPGVASYSTDSTNSPLMQQKIVSQQSTRPLSRISTSSRASVESEMSSAPNSHQQEPISSPRLSRIQQYAPNMPQQSNVIQQKEQSHSIYNANEPIRNSLEFQQVWQKDNRIAQDQQQQLQQQQQQQNHLFLQQPSLNKFQLQPNFQNYDEELNEQPQTQQTRQSPCQQELFRHPLDQLQYNQQQAINNNDITKPRSSSLCDSTSFSTPSSLTGMTSPKNVNNKPFLQRCDKTKSFESADSVFKPSINHDSFKIIRDANKDFRNISDDINEELIYNQQVLSVANNKTLASNSFNNVEDDVNVNFNILNSSNDKVRLRCKDGNKHFSDESSNRSSFYDNFPHQQHLKNNESSVTEDKSNSNIQVFKRPNFGVISQVVPSHMVGVYDPSKYLSLSQSIASTIPTTVAKNSELNNYSLPESNRELKQLQQQRKHITNFPTKSHSLKIVPLRTSPTIQTTPQLSHLHQQPSKERQLNQFLSLTTEGPWTKEKSLFGRSLAAAEMKRKEPSWQKYEDCQRPVGSSNDLKTGPTQKLLDQQLKNLDEAYNVNDNVPETKDSASDNYVSANDISCLNRADITNNNDSDDGPKNESYFYAKKNLSLSRSNDSINKNNSSKNKNYKHFGKRNDKIQSYTETIETASASNVDNNLQQQQHYPQQYQQHQESILTDIPQTCVSMKQLQLQSIVPKPDNNVVHVKTMDNFASDNVQINNPGVHTSKLLFQPSSSLSPQPTRRMQLPHETYQQQRYEQDQISLPSQCTLGTPKSSGEPKRKFVTSMTIPENEIFQPQNIRSTDNKDYNNANKNMVTLKSSSGSLSSSSSSSMRVKPIASEALNFKESPIYEKPSDKQLQHFRQHRYRHHPSSHHQQQSQQHYRHPQHQSPTHLIREEETTTLFTIPLLGNNDNQGDNQFSSNQNVLADNKQTMSQQPTFQQKLHQQKDDDQESSLDSSSVDDSCSLDDLTIAPLPEQPINISQQPRELLTSQSTPENQHTSPSLTKLQLPAPDQVLNANLNPHSIIVNAPKRPPPLVKQDSFNSPDSPLFHQPLPLPTDSVILHHRRHNLMQCSSFQSTSSSSEGASDQEQNMGVVERNRRSSRKNRTKTLV